MFFSNSQSQRSVLTNMGSIIFGPKQSFSTREIHQQHMQIQKKYREKEKQKNITDPIDFEGILQIIGGCTWWQIWVYLLISFQQIPHAMFNLSVVYMMVSLKNAGSGGVSWRDQKWREMRFRCETTFRARRIIFSV